MYIVYIFVVSSFQEHDLRTWHCKLNFWIGTPPVFEKSSSRMPYLWFLVITCLLTQIDCVFFAFCVNAVVELKKIQIILAVNMVYAANMS